MRQRKQHAFTLIELIVVIAILAILAVALIPLVNSFIEKSRISRFLSSVGSLETAATAFQADVGAIPNDVLPPVTLENSEIARNVNELATWDGPYVDPRKHATTPWGGEYLFFTGSSLLGGGGGGGELVFQDGGELPPPLLGGGDNAWRLIMDSSESSETGDVLISVASVQAIDIKLDGSNTPSSGKVRTDTNRESAAVEVSLLQDTSSGSDGGFPILPQ